MENKDYIRQEIENFIIKNTDIKKILLIFQMEEEK